MPEGIIRLGQRLVGTGQKALLAAEVGQAHDGSLGLAHSFIDAAASAGADAVKFQTHIAAAESTRDEKFRVRFSLEDDTRFDYWRRMEFTPEQWRGLAEHCAQKEVLFLSSPFSLEAARLLQELGVPAWKVASGEFDNLPMLEFMASTAKPVILSSGMSPWSELERQVEFFQGHGCPVILLQCTTAYPTPLDQVGLRVMSEMARRFKVPVGLSDHSGTPFPALAAMARGAALVEVHLTFSKQMFGPDATSSLEPAELALVAQARDAFFAMDAPVDKDGKADTLAGLRSQFGHSVALVRDLPAGHRVAREDLALKKPGGGIPWSQAQELEGRRLAREVKAERLLTWEDLEG
ncbi:MAG: N-acetylneuraminate synthase family protein [Proteobacteria bacterium]|nr:N-acetylneuraminate synthase family protein [Pseudomonadota bacterium]MBU4384661.1 N-acetylneuraminate synthase family protein [Pseudomonadota bacterium]MCG2766192.1 N-acetylneuraminate synthase family protein [Desulfarculaceae bacterium]